MRLFLALVLTTHHLTLASVVPSSDVVDSGTSEGRSAQFGLTSDFGVQMHLQQHINKAVAQAGLPQLAGVRQNGGADDGLRCIPKVMEIEELEYDHGIKCKHGYQEKCHQTFITDYKPVSEQKCETNFKKNCHITFKPMPFNDTITVCHTPVVVQCDDNTVGPDICSTHYETQCETRFVTKEVEQDEPVCVMEIIRNCTGVDLPLAPGIDAIDSGKDCEEWPVQKCEIQKKLVKKVEKEAACKKVPREICVPNNCLPGPGTEVCHDEERIQVQNVPQEHCDLQPEEHCFLDPVLVPKLVPKENCVRVPKETCVKTKTNPRRVKKPIVKQWCYNPEDLLPIPE